MLRGDVELGGGVPSGAVEQQNGVGAVGDMARDFLEMRRESAAPTPRAGQMAPKREALSSADRRVGEAAFLAACEGVRQVRAHGRDVLSQRLRLRSRRQLLCLPRRQRAEEIPPRFRPAARRADERRHDDLLRAQAGLRGLRAQAQVLPERSCTRLRGPNGAKDEFLLAATVQNLRNWRSSSPSPRKSSLPEEERANFASPTAVPNDHRCRQEKGFFNVIHAKRSSPAIWGFIARCSHRLVTQPVIRSISPRNMARSKTDTLTLHVRFWFRRNLLVVLMSRSAVLLAY
jgi:hypothetical protein